MISLVLPPLSETGKQYTTSVWCCCRCLFTKERKRRRGNNRQIKQHHPSHTPAHTHTHTHTRTHAHVHTHAHTHTHSSHLAKELQAVPPLNTKMVSDIATQTTNTNKAKGSKEGQPKGRSPKKESDAVLEERQWMLRPSPTNLPTHSSPPPTQHPLPCHLSHTLSHTHRHTQTHTARKPWLDLRQ